MLSSWGVSVMEIGENAASTTPSPWARTSCGAVNRLPDARFTWTAMLGSKAKSNGISIERRASFGVRRQARIVARRSELMVSMWGSVVRVFYVAPPSLKYLRLLALSLNWRPKWRGSGTLWPCEFGPRGRQKRYLPRSAGQSRAFLRVPKKWPPDALHISCAS